jgi:WD40 repeat protein
MPRAIRLTILAVVCVVTLNAGADADGDAWSLHASIRWDLGAVEDVDFMGDTSLALVVDDGSDTEGPAVFTVWDPATQRVARSIRADVTGIVVHAVSADGSRIAGASTTAVKVWDATTGEELLAVERAGGRRPDGNAVALSRDGGLLAAALGGSRVEVWDVTARDRLLAVEADPLAGCVGITPDGKVLVAAGVRHYRVRSWDVASGKELNVYGGYVRRVRSIAFDGSGRTMVTGSGDGSVAVWDVSTRSRTHTFDAVEGSVASVAVSRDGGAVAVGGARGEALLYDMNEDAPREVHRVRAGGSTTVSLRHDGAALAVASGRLQLWPSNPATEPQAGKRSCAWGGDLRVNASGARALTTHGNSTVTLWDIERGVSLATFAAPAAPKEPVPNSLGPGRVFAAFTADGDGFRIVRNTGAVRVCDAATGETLREFALGPLYAYSSAFTRDLTRFANLGRDGEATVWNLEDGRLVGTYLANQAEAARPIRVHLSPRGHALAVTTGRGQATVWDILRGRGPWTFGMKGGLPRHIPARDRQEAGETVLWIHHVADDASAVLALDGTRANLWDVAAGVVAQTGELSGGAHGGPAPPLRDGRTRALLISKPSYLWSSDEPLVLQRVAVAPNEPYGFDANGRLTQDFRAPRDDLAVLYWPAAPGTDGIQSAHRRSRDGRVAVTFVGSRGFDVWRLGKASAGGAPHDGQGAPDVGEPIHER